jgi:hypothetical protein
MRWRTHPHIYEINTRLWLQHLTTRYGRPMQLADIPDDVWRKLHHRGFDGVWCMGVWQRSPVSRARALEDAGLRRTYDETLPDWTDADVDGSPYAIASYALDTALGDAAGLAALQAQLHRCGLGLILDFVPNHVACDHAWTLEHPDWFVQGTDAQRQEHPDWFFQTTQGQWLAHGRDPYFPPWTDTAQVNLFSEGLRQACMQELLRIAAVADGVRCDMAMLSLNATFERIWGAYMFDTVRPEQELWAEAIAMVQTRYPECMLLAEAYWGLEEPLRALGFDYVYDKGLYDRLRHGSAADVRAHLHTSAADQDRTVRFIENHDEARAVTAFGPARSQAAAVVLTTTPGMRLLHDGQMEGRGQRVPLQLVRAPDESDDAKISQWYTELLRLTNAPVFHDGRWQPVVLEDNQGIGTAMPLLAWSWTLPETVVVIVINYSDTTAQGVLRLAAARRIDQQQVLTGHGDAHQQEMAAAARTWHITLEPWSSVLLSPTS